MDSDERSITDDDAPTEEQYQAAGFMPKSQFYSERFVAGPKDQSPEPSDLEDVRLNKIVVVIQLFSSIGFISGRSSTGSNVSHGSIIEGFLLR